MKAIATASIILIMAFAMVGPSVARGAKTYGDTCNFITSGIQIFSDNNYAEACDTEKSLVCALNKCDCVPGSRWEQNIFGQLFGTGGACVRNESNEASGLRGAAAIFVTAMAAILIL